MDTEREQEEIGARSVRVFETVLLHATDVIYWLDGTTAGAVAAMRRILRPVFVELTERPAGLETLTKAGQMAFWRRPGGVIVNGIATEAERARPAVAPFVVAGLVRDAQGLYNPRAFSVTLGSGEGHGVALYPSPAGTRFPTAGGLLGSLRLAGSGSPVPWGLLELSVELSATDTIIFRAQADRNGDFAFGMNRLPPLPESVDGYSAQLSARADVAADPGTPLDIDLLEGVLLGELDQADSFQENIELEIRPGEVRRVNSLNRTYLAVQATV